MAYTPEEESIVINLITRIDQKYKAQAEKALDDLVKRAENSIASDVTKALNDRIRNKQQAIANELKLEDQRRAKELAGLKADITARSKAESELQQFKFKQAQETNRRILLDSEKTRQAELAGLKANIMSRSSQYGIGAGGADIQASGAYSSLATGRTTSDRAYSNYVAQAKSAEQELKASANRVASDQAKAAKEAERAWSKTFMGAIEGGTTFGHKLATTFQYATAGMAYYGLASGLAAMTQAFLDADKAMHMFRGVLELTDSEAQKLQGTVFSIGTTYGGQLKDLNEAALALGRAGIATSELGTALKSVSQLSLVSGESLGVVTDVMVSWSTLYPGKKIGDLGDIIVKVANESKASVADFNTMSTYILTAGQQAGLTAEAVASLAGAFKQIGKGSSTSGTEIRRFFQQLESGSDDVRKAYNNLNINMDQLRENLMQGGDIADATMVQLFEKLRDVPEKEGQKAIMHIEEVLDKATLKSLLAVANSGKKGLDEFKRILGKAKDESQGAAEKAASEVALSYSVAFERIKNTAFQEASVFGQAFTSRLFDGASVGEFDKYIKELTSDTGLLNKTMHNLGVMLGTVIDNVGKLSVLFLLFKAGSWLQVGMGTTSAGFMNMARSLGFVNAGMATLNSLIRANPLLAAGMLGTAIWAASDAVAEYIDGDRRDPGGSAILKAQNAKRLAAEKVKDARALTDELARQETAYKNLSKAASNSSGITSAKLKKQAEQAKQNAIDIRKALGYTDTSKTTTSKVPSISGSTTPKDKDLTTGQIESAAKNALDEELRRIELAEQEYFYRKGITNEYQQQLYHLKTTLRDQLEAIKFAGEYKNKKEDTLKKEIEIEKAKRSINALEENAYLSAGKLLEGSNERLEAAYAITEERKIEIAYERDLARIGVEASIREKDAILTQEERNSLIERELVVAKSISDEKTRQLDISRKYDSNAYDKQQDRIIEDLKAQTDYEKYRNQLMRESDDIADSFYQKVESGAEITELDVKKYEDRLKLIDRSNYKTYVGMTLQQSLQSELNSSLMDFFDIQSEGWMDFERLGMNVLNNILQQMLQMQVVQPLATAGSSALGNLGSMAMSWLASADGNVFDQGHIKAYAKGGTFTNSIVKKPTYFASGGAIGVMGEAGAESVMPLKRNSQGQLGVIASGSSGVQSVNVTIHNEATGEQLQVTRSESKVDYGEMFLDVWIDAVTRNRKGTRDIVRGIR